MLLSRLTKIVLLGLTISLPANAQNQTSNQPSFKASARAQGAPFDLTATETARFASKSYLDVPGFHLRPAAGSRWLMCVYAALAAERGFAHTFVMYPPEGGTRVVVGFTNSSRARPQDVLGVDYIKKDMLDDTSMPVAKMADFCGSLSQYKS